MAVETSQLLMASAAVCLGAFVQGVVGFGMSLTASPILVLLHPALVPVPLMMSGLALGVGMTLRERSGWNWRELGLGIPGMIAGSAAAAVLLSHISAERLPLLLGILVLLAVLLSAVGLRVEPTPRNAFVATLLAGFMSTTASIPGPPLALLYQHAGPTRLRGTLAPLLLASGVIGLSTLTLAGRLNGSDLTLGLCLIPAAFVGFLLSSFGTRWLSPFWVRWAVLVVAGIAGVTAVARGIG